MYESCCFLINNVVVFSMPTRDLHSSLMAVVGTVSSKKASKIKTPLDLQMSNSLGHTNVIGKRKQQGSSNFAPRKTFPLEGYLFCDDQSAFSIPLGINEKKGSE